jgi:hypothetical protein
MAIERKDRSFDRIFEEVDVHSVPSKYINSVEIILRNGDRIQLNDLEEAADLVNHIDKGEIEDISISLDYEAIKGDVTSEIKNVLNSFFKEDE